MPTKTCHCCGLAFPPDNETRLLRITRDLDLIVSRRRRTEYGYSLPYLELAEDAVAACGQTCTLILTERFVERGTFAPAHADHFPTL